MTLASKLLEGYCPEGYEIVEEGLTPDIVMERTNSICVECINQLYAVAEAYFTDDLIAQTQVLTEGVGVVDKIKELIGNFIKQVKKIWDWFIGKVKKFPAWIKSLFSKQKEASDKIGEAIDKKLATEEGKNAKITSPSLSNIQGVVDKAIETNKRFVKEFFEDQKKGLSNTNQIVSALVSDPSRAIQQTARANGTPIASSGYATIVHDLDSATEEFSNGVNDALEKEGLASISEISSLYTKMINDIDKDDKTEEVELKKFRQVMKDIDTKISSVCEPAVKSIDNVIKMVSSNLQAIQSDGFKSKLEKAFLDNTKLEGSGTTTVASKYISLLTKTLSMEVNLLNALMSSPQGALKVAQRANEKLRQAFLSGGDSNSNGADQ